LIWSKEIYINWESSRFSIIYSIAIKPLSTPYPISIISQSSQINQ
jgi:hypothetical protein